MTNRLVDVVVLTRDETPIRSEVAAAIGGQTGVRVILHRVVGSPRQNDANRWATIARARNIGRTLGSSQYLMFVDDDVVLAPDCIANLLSDLDSRAAFSCMAADYIGERQPGQISPHVAMGATLFRREVLDRVEFRWEENRCECQCIADDLRKIFHGIDYSQTAEATHLNREAPDKTRHSSPTPGSSRTAASLEPSAGAGGHVALTREAAGSNDVPTADADGEILVAFNRAHMGLFEVQFVARLREAGNRNTVHAVAYGLRDKQVRALSKLDGVQVHPQPYTVQKVYRDRMLGFQHVLRNLCPKTPVAYWDAGDVLFQSSLEPLWTQIRNFPDKLLVVREPLSYEKNPGHQSWAKSIVDPDTREHVTELIRGKPVVNGGFIAGSAGKLLSYFERANELAANELLGAGGGDQMVLNAYFYRHPDEFAVAEDTWNYCLAGRSGRDCKVIDGQYLDILNNRLVAVVHGNAGTLL